MNAAFCVQGTLLFVGAVLVLLAIKPRKPLPLLVFAAVNSVGNFVIAIVSSGSSGIALVHVTGAAFAIVGGNAAILAGSSILYADGAARWYRISSIALAMLGLVSFGFLAIASLTSTTMILPGAGWERTSVYTIIGWQMLSAGYLARR